MGAVYVGLGGAAGAILRYVLGLIPVRASFPVLTLAINLAGAFAIGCVTGLALSRPDTPKGLVLFAKTGFCGGFTTFSTFSLETLTLLESGRPIAGAVYAGMSVLLCVAGVGLGRYAVSRLLAR